MKHFRKLPTLAHIYRFGHLCRDTLAAVRRMLCDLITNVDGSAHAREETVVVIWGKLSVCDFVVLAWSGNVSMVRGNGEQWQQYQNSRGERRG